MTAWMAMSSGDFGTTGGTTGTASVVGTISFHFTNKQNKQYLGD